MRGGLNSMEKADYGKATFVHDCSFSSAGEIVIGTSLAIE